MKEEIERLINKHPYFKNVLEYTLIESSTEFYKMLYSDYLDMDDKSISLEMIKRILENDDYYTYAIRYFKGEIKKFAVSYIEDNHLGKTISYDKKDLYAAMKKYLKLHRDISSESLIRFKELEKYILFERLEKKYENKSYIVSIDGKKYDFLIDNLFKIIKMDHQEFVKLCCNNKIKYIDGILKEHYLCAIMNFFIEKNVINNYVLNDNITKNINCLIDSSLIDLEAINKLLKTDDTLYEKVNLDQELEHEIVKNMDSNLNPLEKAIYIYIQMCKLLTYDEDFFASHQRGIPAIKHRKIDYISTINKKNNKVVCFEFNLIYAYLIKKYGDINFKSSYALGKDEHYGEGHVNMQFRFEKFLVHADAVKAIIYSDMMHAKLNQPLEGLKCVNKNVDTQNEFNTILEKVYHLTNGDIVNYTESFDDILLQYNKKTLNIKKVPIEEKINILKKKIISCKLDGIDALSYLLQLRKIIFNDYEMKGNIVMTIVKGNNIDTKPTIIIAFNPEWFLDSPLKTSYYLYNSHDGLNSIDFDELQNRFDNNEYEYLSEDKPKIPGIISYGGIGK